MSDAKQAAKGRRLPRVVAHPPKYPCGHCPLVFRHLMHLAAHGITAHGLSITR